MHDDCGPSEAQSRPNKRSFTVPTLMFRSGHRHRRNSDGSLLDSSGELRLGIAPIETLPQELLLQVLEHHVDPALLTAGFPEKEVLHYNDYFEDFESQSYRLGSCADHKAICRKDLRNVCLVSRKLKPAATTLLYRCAHLATDKSPGNFVLALTAHPELQPLVRHISVPTYLGMPTDHFDFAFSHDKNDWKLDDDPRAPQVLLGDFFAGCGEYLRGGLLRLIVPLVPNLRSLIIPQANLMDGPFTKDLVLCDLTMLRITLMSPNDVLFCRLEHIWDASRTIDWLRPEMLGQRFPSLRRLEVYTPTGRWEANLITEIKEGAWPPLKFVESLTTATTNETGSAEWDLSSLEQPIFNAFKLRTLEFDGPGRECDIASNFTLLTRWDLNRFLFEKGRSLSTLSLDWECHMAIGVPACRVPHQIYFGWDRLNTLNRLTNLTRLTVSLQALFCYSAIFNGRVQALEANPDTELSKLFPPSLRTLRVSEYLAGLYEQGSWYVRYNIHGFDIVVLREHNDFVYRFLQVLRSSWIPGAEGRELWFRPRADLNILATRSEVPMGRDRLAGIFDYSAKDDENMGFERVWGLHEYHGDDSDDSDQDVMDVSGLDSTESEDEKSDGELDQA